MFDAVAQGQFYIYSHPQALGSVQVRMENVVQARNPTDPFVHKPELGASLKASLRACGLNHAAVSWPLPSWQGLFYAKADITNQ